MLTPPILYDSEYPVQIYGIDLLDQDRPEHHQWRSSFFKGWDKECKALHDEHFQYEILNARYGQNH